MVKQDLLNSLVEIEESASRIRNHADSQEIYDICNLVKQLTQLVRQEIVK